MCHTPLLGLGSKTTLSLALLSTFFFARVPSCFRTNTRLRRRQSAGALHLFVSLCQEQVAALPVTSCVFRLQQYCSNLVATSLPLRLCWNWLNKTSTCFHQKRNQHIWDGRKYGYLVQSECLLPLMCNLNVFCKFVWIHFASRKMVMICMYV
jgi:hypothetical protein